MICENPHCQYFPGLSEFTDVDPFDSSEMETFRRRFPVEAVARINEAIITARDETDDADSSDDDEQVNRGTLILDATCAPADVSYPTDTGVLNETRLVSERLIDELHDPSGDKEMPRTYRLIARKNYLLFVQNRRPASRLVRKTLRSQLQYIRCNMRYIQAFSKSRSLTTKRETKLSIVQQVYKQQLKMYEERSHQHADRIVIVSLPHVGCIVRGKVAIKTEFGTKIAISPENGYVQIEQLSWDAFKESQTLQSSRERYFERNDHYHEHILADKIYQTRDNLNYCSTHGITMNGPKLSRPPKDRALHDEQKRQERLDAGERNAIESKYGEDKYRYV